MGTASGGTGKPGTTEVCGNDLLTPLNCHMKKLLLAFLLFPLLCSAQKYPCDQLEISTDTMKATYWQVLRRATARNPLTAFFRISNVNDSYVLELKMMLGGMSFVVPRSAELELEFGNHEYINLFNTEYKKSCMGCGARDFERNDIQGVTLKFPISDENFHKLMHHYVYHFRIHMDQNLPGANVNENRSQNFMDAIWLVYTAAQFKGNTPF